MTTTWEKSDEAGAVREAVREVTARFGRDYWLACIEAGSQPLELLAALGDSGLLGLGVPEEHGGQGGGLPEQITLIEQLGSAGLPSYSFLVGNFVRHTLLRHGSTEQIDRFVPPTTTGRIATSFALTEPDAGTNSFAVRTHAERVEGGWSITGQKVFITAAGEASQIMIVARTNAVSEPKASLSLFMTELPVDGITFSLQRVKAAAPDNQYIVFFDNVFVPDDGLVGEVGAGTSSLFDALNAERMLGAAMSLGLGEFILAKGVAYAKERAPFGTPIGSYQAVSHPLARARVQLDAARSFIYARLEEMRLGEEGTYHASAAKMLASEAANAALDATVQAHGGWAFDYDLDVIALSETLRLFRVAPISNEAVLNFVATKGLGLPRSS